MLEKLFLFCKGYVIVKIRASSGERFLNLCKAREIEIIDIIYINNAIYCKMTCKDYFQIKPVVKKTGHCPKIEKKIGLSFLLRRIGKRKGLLFGTVLAGIILLQCTGRIWQIDVQGGFLHTRQQIVQVLKNEMQVYGSINRETVNCAEIEKQLRLIYNEIGWVSVEKRGCNLYIKLNESTMPEASEETEMPCHIIAERDGIVKGIEVVSGVAQVKNGDTVEKGDILISGIVPVIGDYDELLYNNPVGAKGTVYIETDFTYQAVYSMRYEEKIETKSKLGFSFFWFQKKIFSYIPRYSEWKYDIITYDVVPFAFRDYEAPFLIRMYKATAYTTQMQQMTDEEAKTKANKAFEEFLDDWEAQGVEILNSRFLVETGSQLCTAKAEGVVCGNFVSYQEINEEEWKIEDEYSGDNP